MSASKRPYDRTSYIMVVDDDQTLLKFFKIHLNKFFSRVVVVKNAREALEAMKEKEIDLVLSDLMMPRVDGLALLKKIKNQDASIPVYLISGALLDDAELRELKNVADGFMRKPFTIEQIQDFIKDGMDKRETLKKLSELINDQRSLKSLLGGKITTRKFSKNPESKKEIENLLVNLGHENYKAS